jgi:hypothetical protein
VVRIETALGAVHGDAGPQYRAVELERQPRKRCVTKRVVSHLPQQIAEPLAHRRGRLLQRARDRPICGQLPEPCETHEDRIALQQRQMAQAAAADQQHPDQRQGDPERAVVAIEAPDREDLLQSARESRTIEIAAQDLETTVGAQLLSRENDRKICLDTASNCTFARFLILTNVASSVEEGWLAPPS